jgi:hypothetical protein
MRRTGWTALCFTIAAFSLTGCSKTGSTTTVSSVTYLTIIHAAPYSSAATVYLNDTLITQSNGIATGGFSPRYGTIKPGSYTAKFEKAGSDSLFDQLPASTYDTLSFYTLLLYNDLGGKAAHAIKITDNFNGVSNNGNAYYRFFNLSPDCPSVNLYLNGNLVQSNRTPTDNGINNQLNAFIPIQAGKYTLAVKDASTDSVLAQYSSGLQMNSGSPFTFWITGTKASNTLSINILAAQF